MCYDLNNFTLKGLHFNSHGCNLWIDELHTTNNPEGVVGR